MKNIGVVVAGAVATVIGVVCVIVALSAAIALPVMWLYNYVFPYQFGCKEIDFLHAWALNLLCGLIFRSGNYNYQQKSDKN